MFINNHTNFGIWKNIFNELEINIDSLNNISFDFFG